MARAVQTSTHHSSGDKKLYLGGRLRRLRRELGVSQSQFAEELGLSPSYVNHLERNQRPVTAQVLLKLAEAYDLDLKDFVSENDGAGANDLGEVFSDALFKDLAIPRHEIADVASSVPAVAEGIVRLFQALADRRQAASSEAQSRAEGAATPTDWVRDYIQSQQNYFPELDELGEAMFNKLAPGPQAFAQAARARLKETHRIEVSIAPDDVLPDAVRRFDRHRRRLFVSETLTGAGQAFAVAYQLAAAEHGEQIEQAVQRARAPNEAIAQLLKVSLINYFAAAMMMPYERFRNAAEEMHYDIERLRARFGVSYEQACHRLTTLSRSGARGVPFFMLRVDPAGNVSKRFANGPFPFSRFGGNCPRWNIHSAFRTPGRIIRQVIEAPDGERYFTVSRTVRRLAAPHAGEDGELALGMGCALKHAHRLVYSAGLDLAQPQAVPIGPACRYCERPACPQRAMAPINRALSADEHVKTITAFHFTDG